LNLDKGFVPSGLVLFSVLHLDVAPGCANGSQCNSGAYGFRPGVFMKSMLLALCVWTIAGSAAQIEKVNFPEEMSVGSQKLVLNGAGVRAKKKLGMNFKVYVAGLYLNAKSSEATAIINSPATKVLELVFLRDVDRETLQEAWQEGFANNCKGDCETAKDHFMAFNDTMVDVKENSRLKMTFDKDGVAIDLKGAKRSKNAQIIGETFKKILLAIFIGDSPPTPELKKALLGQAGLDLAH